jgi:hypothetical protein
MLQIKDLGGTAGIMRSVGDKEVKMKRGVLEAWSVDAADWPREGSAEEKLRFLVRYASSRRGGTTRRLACASACERTERRSH